MKVNFTGKYKIWVVITLIVLVAGLALLGIFGFNSTIDSGNNNIQEVTVMLETNVGADADKNASEMKATAETYFTEKGITYTSLEKLDNGNVLIYRFSTDVSNVIDKTELQAQIDDKITTGLTSSVEIANALTTNFTQWGSVALALGVSVILVAVYTFIREKLAGAIAVLATSIISALLFTAIVALARIPAYPFIEAGIALSALLGGVFATGIVDRCMEMVKNVGNDKKSYEQISGEATNLSLFRLIIVSALILLFAIVMVAVASFSLKMLGLQVLIAGISSVFATIGYSGIIWALVRKTKKDRKIKNKPVIESDGETEQQA